MNLFFNSGGIYCLMEYIGAIREIKRSLQSGRSLNASRLSAASPQAEGAYDRASGQAVPLHYYGCSAGAGMMFVCLLVLNDFISADDLDRLFGEVVDTIVWTDFDTAPIFTALMTKLTPYVPENITDFTNGRFHVGMTGADGFRFVNQFQSRQDIYHHIIVGSNIPGISSYPSTIDGVQFMDGVFGLKHDSLPPDTIIFRNTSRAPLSLTIPPLWVRQLLISYGAENARRNIATYNETGTSRETLATGGTYDISPEQIQWLLWFQSVLPQNPKWRIL